MFTFHTAFLAHKFWPSVTVLEPYQYPFTVYIICSRSVPRRDYCDVWNSYCSFGMEFYSVHSWLWWKSIVVMSLFSVFCIGRHHAIIGLHRGCQLRRLYVHVLWRHLARQRLANALGCAASLPKLRSCCTVNQSVRGHSKGKSPLLTFVHICTGSVCVCLSCRKLLHLCMCINAGEVYKAIVKVCSINTSTFLQVINYWLLYRCEYWLAT